MFFLYRYYTASSLSNTISFLHHVCAFLKRKKNLTEVFFTADCLDFYCTQCWVEACAVFILCIRIQNIWEAKSFWTTCNIYSMPNPSSHVLLLLFLLCFCLWFRWFWMQEEGEDEGRMMRMGKRLLRSLSLAFGCIAFASLVCPNLCV